MGFHRHMLTTFILLLLMRHITTIHSSSSSSRCLLKDSLGSRTSKVSRHSTSRLPMQRPLSLHGCMLAAAPDHCLRRSNTSYITSRISNHHHVHHHHNNSHHHHNPRLEAAAAAAEVVAEAAMVISTPTTWSCSIMSRQVCTRTFWAWAKRRR